MRREKFYFVVEGVEFAGIDIPLDIEYILWIWRGNYLNLGPGSEMGIYYRPAILPSDPDGLDHYFAHSEIALPMQLYLYDYESGKNIFSWRPIEDQWWICSFSLKKSRSIYYGIFFHSISNFPYSTLFAGISGTSHKQGVEP